MRQVVMLWVIVTVAVTAGLAQSPAEEEKIAAWAASLARNVAKADRDVYLPVKSPWKNPTLMLDLEGISIRTGDEGSRKPTDLVALAEDLASLPAEAWPLGRVVVLAHTGRAFPFILLSGGTESLPPSDPKAAAAAARSKRVIEILQLLDVEIVHAPVN